MQIRAIGTDCKSALSVRTLNFKREYVFVKKLAKHLFKTLQKSNKSIYFFSNIFKITNAWGKVIAAIKEKKIASNTVLSFKK